MHASMQRLTSSSGDSNIRLLLLLIIYIGWEYQRLTFIIDSIVSKICFFLQITSSIKKKPFVELHLPHRYCDLVYRNDNYQHINTSHRFCPPSVLDDPNYRGVLCSIVTKWRVEDEDKLIILTVFRWHNEIDQGFCSTFMQFDLFLHMIWPNFA